MQTQQIAGQWYEFKLNLIIPPGESRPGDWLNFLRWLGEDHGQVISDLSLIPITAETESLDDLTAERDSLLKKVSELEDRLWMVIERSEG